MPSLAFQIVSWPSLGVALLVFGFAPGAVLRLIVLAFPRDDPRRRELLSELYAVPRIERPFWVFEQLELALFEGLRRRFARRMPDDLAGVHESLGYSGPVACAAAGITYRQLDYWARTGLVEPSLHGAGGSGSLGLYSFHDILMLKTIGRLLNSGVSLGQIRPAVAYMRGCSSDGLRAATVLLSDGENVSGCSNERQVVELLADGGEGFFGISLSRVWREVDGTLMELPGEPAAASGGAAGGTR